MLTILVKKALIAYSLKISSYHEWIFANEPKFAWVQKLKEVLIDLAWSAETNVFLINWFRLQLKWKYNESK